MAFYRINRGKEENLPSALTEGSSYFCIDTGNFFIDHKNTSGTLVRTKVSSKYAEKLRYTKDGNLVEIDPTTILTDSNYETKIGTATQSKSGLISIKDKAKLDGIATGAEVNQNAFSNVVVGSTTIAADSKTDSLTFAAGSNITITPDATNDKITIAAKDTTYDDATQRTAGLMSAADKKKLDGIATGAQVNTVTGIKGNSESSYRIGNVNITKANIGLGNVDNESKATMFTSAALTGTPTAPTANSNTNSTQIATTAFVQSAIDSKIAAADAMIYKGTIGTSGTITSLPATHKTGWTYKVITANTYAGKACEVGDMIICLTDGTEANDSHWTVVQSNIDGAVTGPASSVANRVAIFNGSTGKVIKDSGFTIASSVPANAKFTDTTYSTATPSTDGLMSKDDKTKLNTIASGAEVNQNAFSNIVVGSTTIAADTKTDSLTFAAGSNVTITPDATNDKITIAAKDTTYSIFGAATSSAAGTKGLVPAPTAGANTKFLRGDGTWQTIDTGTIVSGSTTATAGASVITNPLSVAISDAAQIYQNGILLTKNTHYTINSAGNIALNGYTADEGDIFTVVSKSTGVDVSLNATAANIGLVNSAGYFDSVNNVESAIAKIGQKLNGGVVAGVRVNGTVATPDSNGVVDVASPTIKVNGNVVSADTNGVVNITNIVKTTGATMTGNLIAKATSTGNHVRNISVYASDATLPTSGNDGDIVLVYSNS